MDFVFTNNIMAQNAYGIVGTGIAPGIQSLDAYFPKAIFKKNVIVGGSADHYPRDTFFGGSFAEVHGTNLGVDLGALPAAIRPTPDHRR